ncbi:MAG: methionine synthase [Propionibacteriaceae bacterium]|nr:methionine synthase [Propionibacteriaceae bacterium]
MTIALRTALTQRVLIGDGAMGTELERAGLSVDDFGGFEGCNEMLNLTRPDVIAAVHRSYLEAGSDFVLTNTFGCNVSALSEYGLAHRIAELAEAAAVIAREAANTAQRGAGESPRFVVADVGPGTKLPTLGQVTFQELCAGYATQIRAMAAVGIDAVLIETCQDLLQAKAAVIAAKRIRRELGIDLPIWASVTIEPNGTMLLGSDVSVALNVLEALGAEVIGLNCATGPDMMAPYLQVLARHATARLRCAPNAGLPELTATGPKYPLTPSAFAAALTDFTDRYGLAIVDGCCGTTPEHIRALATALSDRRARIRIPEPLPAISGLYETVSLKQDINYLAVGERANVAGSKAFREALLADDYEQAVAIAKRQTNTHVLDLCVDYVGRDGVRDMAELAARFATSIDQPVMLDSSVPAVMQAGLEHTPGRAILNSAHLEDAAKFARMAELAAEHGSAVVALTIDEQGMARTTERKLAVAERLLTELAAYGIAASDVLVDFLTYPITTGAAENRGDAAATIRAIAEFKQRHPEVGTVLGVSNVSFGIKPEARRVLNSVFLYEARQAGLQAAIVDAGKIMPLEAIPEPQVRIARDLIWNLGDAEYDPLSVFLAEFDDAEKPVGGQGKAGERYPGLSLSERLTRRIIAGDNDGLLADLDAAIACGRKPLDIINTELLEGMRQVGQLFGEARMQLPFVLASAETMKRAVTHLEPLIAQSGIATTKGTIVLATVRGDVHDIGKNLVDIILSNNGYRVVNLGIKQPIADIIAAALRENATAIGLSGLLVKSTVVMKDDLAEIARRGLSMRFPVILGGAALTRAYVDDQLAPSYPGVVRYAKDAFAGLSFMEEPAAKVVVSDTAQIPVSWTEVRAEPRLTMPVAVPQGAPGLGSRGVGGRAIISRTPGNVSATPPSRTPTDQAASRPESLPPAPILDPPFWGAHAIDVSIDELLAYLDLRTLLTAKWGLRAPDGFEQLLAEQKPRLEAAIARARELVELRAVYGYFPVRSRGDTVLVLGENGEERAAFVFPRQTRPPYRCLADFFVTSDANQAALLPLQLVSVGARFAHGTQALFTANRYRDYLELHGLGMQLAEAGAEWLHNRIRAELGIPANQGERFSFGYPACPDLAQRQILFDLLGAERIGVSLTETFQLDPEAATDALIVAHPQAHHFSVR